MANDIETGIAGPFTNSLFIGVSPKEMEISYFYHFSFYAVPVIDAPGFPEGWYSLVCSNPSNWIAKVYTFFWLVGSGGVRKCAVDEVCLRLAVFQDGKSIISVVLANSFFIPPLYYESKWSCKKGTSLSNKSSFVRIISPQVFKYPSDWNVNWNVNTKLDQNYRGCCLNSKGVK